MVADKIGEREREMRDREGPINNFSPISLLLSLSLYFSLFLIFLFLFIFFFAREKPWASHGDTRVEHRGTIHPSK